MTINGNASKARLEAAGLKATHQRIVILTALLQAGFHPSAEVLYDMLKTDNPTLSLGTVYRTLETFVQAGLAKTVDAAGGSRVYDARLDTHHHLICDATGDIFDFEDDELTRLIHQRLQRLSERNYHVRDFQLVVHVAPADGDTCAPLPAGRL